MHYIRIIDCVQMNLVNGAIGVSAQFPVEMEDNSATGPVCQETVLMISMN